MSQGWKDKGVDQVVGLGLYEAQCSEHEVDHSRTHEEVGQKFDQGFNLEDLNREHLGSGIGRPKHNENSNREGKEKSKKGIQQLHTIT